MGSFLSPRAISLPCAVSLPHSLRGGAHTTSALGLKCPSGVCCSFNTGQPTVSLEIDDS